MTAKPKWITPRTLELMEERKQLKSLITRSQEDKERYKLKDKEVRHVCAKDKKDYLEGIYLHIQDGKHSSQAGIAYKYIRGLIKPFTLRSRTIKDAQDRPIDDSVQNIAINRIRLIFDSSNTLVYRDGPNIYIYSKYIYITVGLSVENVLPMVTLLVLDHLGITIHSNAADCDMRVKSIRNHRCSSWVSSCLAKIVHTREFLIKLENNKMSQSVQYVSPA